MYIASLVLLILGLLSLLKFTKDLLLDEKVSFAAFTVGVLASLVGTWIAYDLMTDDPDISRSEIELAAGIILILAIVLGCEILALVTWWMCRKIQDHQQRKTLAAETARKWGRLAERLEELHAKYADAETSPLTVSERPIILDVSHEVTQKFHTALADAVVALDRHLDLDSATTAVTAAERSWRYLWTTAGEVGLSGAQCR